MPKTILIIEDDDMNMRLESSLLEAQGYDVIQSADGKDTMELAKKHHPDLIIMDIQLPDVSGVEHTKALKADEGLKDIPILAVTAFAMKGDKEEFLEAGCDGYISKPIDVNLFLDTVAKFLA